MNNIIAIFRRELASYFDSPLAYIVIPAFLMLVGGFSLYFQDIFVARIASLRVVFFWAAVFNLLLIPAVTMKLFAEERRSGTIEMLATLPVTETEMVLGKYLAALALITIALVLTVTYPITLGFYGDLDLGPLFGGYVGLFLMGAAFTAIGCAASALTHSQVIAFLIALTVGMVPFATGYALASVPAVILPVVQYISFEYHMGSLSKGVVDSRNIIFYGSVIAMFLHLAVFALERRRLK